MMPWELTPEGALEMARHLWAEGHDTNEISKRVDALRFPESWFYDNIERVKETPHGKRH